MSKLSAKGGDLEIKDYSAESPRIEDIKSYIISYQNRKKCNLDLLIVDYADLITPTKHYKNERTGLKEVYTNLRRLGNEFKIPVITGSQANKKTLSKKNMGMDDADESFIGKMGVADIVLGLCQTPEELEDELCRLLLLKNRSTGIHKTIHLTMKPSLYYLGEYDRDEFLRGSNKNNKPSKSIAHKL
jgi:replicative DNA helicase